MIPREIKIRTPNLEFAAIEWGDPEAKPIVALHGWMDNAASFTPLASKLKGVRLIAVDQAGHGLSQHRPPGFSYDIWHYVEDLVAILDALELSRVSLLAHSMGAVVSTMAASSILLDRVSSMVLVDGLFPMPRTADESPMSLTEYLTARQGLSDSKPGAYYRTLDQAVRARAMGLFKVSKKSSELLVERSLKNDGEGWVWTNDPRLKMSSPVRFTLEQSLAFPKALKCSTHLIHADAGLIQQLILQNKEQLPDIRYYPLAGSHHLHMDGCVEAVADIANTVFSEAM